MRCERRICRSSSGGASELRSSRAGERVDSVYCRSWRERSAGLERMLRIQRMRLPRFWQLCFPLASVHVAVFVAVSSVAVVSITATVSFERLSPRSRVTRVDLNIS